jgi:hypothetical protein
MKEKLELIYLEQISNTVYVYISPKQLYKYKRNLMQGKGSKTEYIWRI